MNIHEYQAKEVLRGFGVTTGKGIAAFTVDEAVKAAETLGGPVWVVKAQIHAGGRGKGGGVKVVKSRRGREGRSQAHARHDAGHAPDRPRGQAGAAPLHRGRHGHRPRALSLDPGRPRNLARRLHRLHRRRHGHRGGGARHAGEDHHRAGRSGRRLSRLRRPPHRLRAEARGRPGQAVREDDRPALQGLRREGHEPARDQSARRHQGRQADLPRRQDQLRLATRSTATPRSRNCATSRKKTRRKSRPPSTISPTWRSMAPSAAW